MAILCTYIKTQNPDVITEVELNIAEWLRAATLLYASMVLLQVVGQLTELWSKHYLDIT